MLDQSLIHAERWGAEAKNIRKAQEVLDSERAEASEAERRAMRLMREIRVSCSVGPFLRLRHALLEAELKISSEKMRRELLLRC